MTQVSDTRVVAQILHHIAVSTYHLRMYGVENDNVLQSVDIVVSSVAFLTGTAPAVPVSFEFEEGRSSGFDALPPRVKVNGVPFETQADETAWVQSVVRLAKKTGWSKLTLSAGLTNEEWLEFLKTVSGGTDKGLREVLQEAPASFPHVGITWGSNGGSLS